MIFLHGFKLKDAIFSLKSPFKDLYIALLLLILIGLSCHASSSTLDTYEDFKMKDLGHIIEYLEDPDRKLSLAQTKQSTWQTLEEGSFSKGFSDSQYWFHFDVINRSNSHKHYVIEIRHPFLDTLDIHYEQNGKIILTDHLGDKLANNRRRLKHSDFLSSFSLQANQKISVYIRIASKSTLQLPIKLWEKDAYKEQNHSNSIFVGVLLGIMFSIAAYHLLIYFSILEPVYLYYGFFMLGTAVTFACLNGLPGFFLWPEQAAESDNILLIGLLTCSTFNCFFARGVVDTPVRTPRMNLLINICAATGIIGIICIPVLPYAFLLKLSFFTGILAIILVVIIFIITSLQSYKPAYYALAGSLFAGLGTCVTMLDKMGVIPSSSFNGQAVYIGFTLMTLVQAFALSYRIKVANDSHKKAQEDLLIAQRTLNSELDSMVRQRTEELEQANERLVELSTVDSLTGIRNRRFFDEALEREYANAFRNKQPLGLLVLDIDHFKSVNDNYGHAFGDICLTDMGGILQSSVRRPPDIVARYGGEEFVVVLPNTDLEGTIHVASVIRDKIKAHIFKDEQQTLNLTVSIGALSQVPESANEGLNMFEQTDQLLYKAKKNGRDRICSNAE